MLLKPREKNVTNLSVYALGANINQNRKGEVGWREWAWLIIYLLITQDAFEQSGLNSLSDFLRLYPEHTHRVSFRANEGLNFESLLKCRGLFHD